MSTLKKIRIIKYDESARLGFHMTPIMRCFGAELEGRFYTYPFPHYDVFDPYDFGGSFMVSVGDCEEVNEDLPPPFFKYEHHFESKNTCCSSPNIISNTAGGHMFYVCRSCKKETDKNGYKI